MSHLISLVMDDATSRFLNYFLYCWYDDGHEFSIIYVMGCCDMALRLIQYNTTYIYIYIIYRETDAAA